MNITVTPDGEEYYKGLSAKFPSVTPTESAEFNILHDLLQEGGTQEVLKLLSARDTAVGRALLQYDLEYLYARILKTLLDRKYVTATKE